MSPEDAGKHVIAAVSVKREDIARAKNWLVQNAGGTTSGMADQWLRGQNLVEPQKVDTDAQNCPDLLTDIARAYSVRLAFYQAVTELTSAGELTPAAPPTQWKPALEYKVSRGSGPIPVNLSCCFPERVERAPLVSDVPADPDIFLKGIDCKALHSGIREAIDRALDCFRRGLYMPATAMLAAGAEATWIECGSAVAKKLADTKLEGVVRDSYVSISKKVTETYKVLEKSNAKQLLKDAGRTVADIRSAEVWTTALRERRNALHWGKNQSFIADHSETGTLLMAAPQHLGTLEAIRAAC